MKPIAYSAVLIILLPTLAIASEADISGKWEANVMGSVIKIAVNQNGAAISGVAHIYNIFGKKDTYHFSGSINNGVINARHSSGHAFSGNPASPTTVAGVLTTKEGRKIQVTAGRR